MAKSTKRKSGRPGGRKSGPQQVRKARLGDWIRAARLPTLPLSIAPDRARHRGRVLRAARRRPRPRAWHWWRAARLPHGRGLPPDRRQFRERLLRRDPRHRRGAHRAAAPHRVRRRRSRGRCSPSRSCSSRSRHWPALSSPGGPAVVVRRRRGRLHRGRVVLPPAAGAPTGTTRSARVAVFIFFGLVATLGTQFAILGLITDEGWLVAIAAGAFATATILIANTRDRVNDKAAGKRTLSVLIGNWPSRILYVVLLLVPYGVAAIFGVFYFDDAWLAYFTLIITVPAAIIALSARTPKGARPRAPAHGARVARLRPSYSAGRSRSDHSSWSSARRVRVDRLDPPLRARGEIRRDPGAEAAEEDVGDAQRDERGAGSPRATRTRARAASRAVRTRPRRSRRAAASR